MGTFDYIDSMLMATLAPLVLGFLLLFAYAYTKYLQNKADSSKEDQGELYVVPPNLVGIFPEKSIKSLRDAFTHYDKDSSGEILHNVREIKIIMFHFLKCTK